MRKGLLFFPFLLLFALQARSQQDLATDADTTKYWDVNGTTTLTFSQTSFSNWAGGGDNSISGIFQFGLNANYAKRKHTWENRFDLAYGLIKQGDSKLFKSDDRWEINSKYAHSLKNKWFYAATLIVRSQFAAGYSDPSETNKISDLFAPGYIIPSLGFEYKPNKKFSAFLSPITARFTIVMDQELADRGAFGVEPAHIDENGNLISRGENGRKEVGALLRVRYENEIMKNIKLLIRTEILSDYLDKPQNLVVNTELQLNMRVNKYITTNFTLHTIYDDNINVTTKNSDGMTVQSGPELQVKQIFGAGFNYTF